MIRASQIPRETYRRFGDIQARKVKPVEAESGMSSAMRAQPVLKVLTVVKDFGKARLVVTAGVAMLFLRWDVNRLKLARVVGNWSSTISGRKPPNDK